MHLITRIIFSFTIALLCINAKAQLTITDQNPAATDEDTPIELTIAQLIITDPNNTDPNNYILTVHNGSNYSYSENTITPATNFNGTLTVPVTVNNGIEESNTYNFIISVSGVNDAPVITSLPITTINEDVAYSYSITATDADNDALHFTLNEAPSWLSISDNGDGTASLTGTPNNSDIGNHTVTITLSDNILTAQQSFSVEVINVNDAPVITSSPITTINEDVAYSYSITATDADNDPLQITLTQAPTWLSITDNGDGTASLTGTPTNNDVGSNYVTLRVSDGNLFVDQTFTATVINVNDAPTFTSTPITSVQQGSSYSYTITTSDIDNATLSITAISKPSWLTLSATVNNQATLTGNATQAQVGSHEVTLRVSDGSASVDQTFTVTVINVNDAPVITSSPITTINEDVVYSYTITATDADNDPLQITLTQAPEWLSLTDNGDGTASLIGTPTNSNVGGHQVTIRVSDGNLSIDQTFTVTVINVNDAPTFTSTPITSVQQGSIYSYTITTSDIDNTTLSITAISKPSWLTLSATVNNQATLTGNTTQAQVGSHQVTLRVSDGITTVDQTFTITVININDSPVITSSPITTINEDAAYSYTLTATDADNDALRFTLTQAPSWLSLTDNGNGTALLSGTPTNNNVGVQNVSFTVSDNILSAQQTFTITVNNVNDAPVINSANTTFTTNEDTPITLSINNFNITDIDNSYPTGFSLIINNGSNYTVSGNVVTPNTNFYGTLTVPIQVNDNQSINNLSNIYNLSITVTAANDAPALSSIEPSTLTFTENGAALTITHSLTITDIDNANLQSATVTIVGFIASEDVLTFTPVSGISITWNSSTGTLILSGSTSLANYTTLLQSIQYHNSTDNPTTSNRQIQFTVYDGAVQSNIVSRYIAITAVNDTPVALDISTSTKENVAKPIPILSSVSDAENSISLNSLIINTIPQHGTTAIDKINGIITYTPATGYTGSDSFKYTICDTQNACATATVSITVSNETPNAVNDLASLNEDGTITINVLSNDTDPQNNISPASLTIINQPAHGTVVINSDHTTTYTPTTNYNGSDSFSYQICDATNYCATANVTITISAVNDVPVLTDDSATTPEDTPILVNVLANDNDAKDANSSLNASSLSITIQPAHGTAIVQNGQIYYTPASNYFGNDVLTYSMSDNGLPLPALTANAKLNITITSVNDKPQITGQQSISTNEDTPLTLNINQLSITDIDNSQNDLTISVSAGTNYTAKNTTITPSSNYNGILTIPIQVSDGQLLSDIFNLTMTVNAVNDKPVAMDETFYTAESTPINLNVLANDNDASDPSGGINPATLTILRQPAHGSAIILPNYTINYSPNSAYWGNDTIVYRIQDKGYPMPALADTAIVVIKISRLTPEAIDDNVSTTEDKSISINLLENDTDTGNNIAPSTVQIMTQPSHGTLSGLQGGIVTYSPSINYNGSDYFTYQVKDITNLTSNVATVNISILPLNDAPVAQNDTYNAYTSQPTVIEVLSNDTDVDNNLDASLTQVTTLPTHGNAIVNTNGTITYTSNDGFTGSDSFIYSITDSDGLTASATVFLTIQTGNIAPTAVNDYTQTNEDQSVDINPLANDSDPNNNLNNESLAITTLPKHGTASIGAQQRVTYTPETNYNGNDTIVYQICDTGIPSSLCATAQIIITITAINDAPVAQNDDIETVDGANMVVDILSNDSDADNDALTPTLINDVPDARYQASINSNGELEITTTAGSYCYDVTINYTISDGNGSNSTAAINISVLPADNDQDGIPNAVEGLEIDSDNDLTPNYLDTDSDNDNIPDVTESQMSNACTDEPVDTDNDGTPNYLDSDSDNDGVADIAEGIDDCDNDGTVNYIDAIDDCPDRVLVAETFSPNGDGINDYFVIPIISEYPQNELSVFNRWGAQVYTKVNYDNSWDGRSSSSTLNSDILPEGTYFYVLKLGNDSRVLKGFIYIKR